MIEVAVCEDSEIARCKLKISKWRSTVKSYIENFKKYRFLLWELVKKGVKLKYRRSYLCIFLTVSFANIALYASLNPLISTIVSYLRFAFLWWFYYILI